MEGLKLRATHRKVLGKQVSVLRREEVVPGIIYGYGIDPIPVQFERREIEKTLAKAGTSMPVQVHIEGMDTSHLTIFRAVQHHTTKRNVTHVDLLALNAQKVVRVPVPVVFTGISSAVETYGGSLNHVLNELEIEALPMALVPMIEINVSILKELGQSILVKDIVPPPGVRILNALDATIVQVTAPTQEAEVVAAVAAPVAEVEVVRKRKTEAEE